MSAPTPFPDSSSDWPYGAPPPPQYGAPPLASWGRRVGAYLLDLLFFLLLAGVPIMVLYVVLLATMNEDDANAVFTLSWYGGSLLFFVLYYPLTMRRAGNNGQTWGKQAVGIRVVKEDGQRVTGGFAFVREGLVKGLLMGICFIVTILNYLSPLWDDRNQAWHDKIVNTMVVQA